MCLFCEKCSTILKNIRNPKAKSPKSRRYVHECVSIEIIFEDFLQTIIHIPQISFIKNKNIIAILINLLIFICLCPCEKVSRKCYHDIK